MPKKAIFKKKQIFNKAYEMFEKEGLEEITARNLAKALNASPAPIYSCYESMDIIKDELIAKAKKRFIQYLKNDFTELVFLNIGIGICLFARKEKQLFKSIFLKEISYRDTVSEFIDIVRNEMAKDPRFESISAEEREEIFFDAWIYTHGLATLIATGFYENPTDEYIEEMLMRAPAALFYMRLEGKGPTGLDVKRNENPTFKERKKRVPKVKIEILEEVEELPIVVEETKPVKSRKNAKELEQKKREIEKIEEKEPVVIEEKATSKTKSKKTKAREQENLVSIEKQKVPVEIEVTEEKVQKKTTKKKVTENKTTEEKVINKEKETKRKTLKSKLEEVKEPEVAEKKTRKKRVSTK